MIFSIASSTIQTILGVLGILSVEHSMFLGCADHGQEWIYLTAFGNTFSTLHIVMILVHCATCVNVFYRIPKGHLTPLPSNLEEKLI
jgi:ABC-type branched-subunit amino acid transport system permease subunit